MLFGVSVECLVTECDWSPVTTERQNPSIRAHYVSLTAASASEVEWMAISLDLMLLPVETMTDVLRRDFNKQTDDWESHSQLFVPASAVAHVKNTLRANIIKSNAAFNWVDICNIFPSILAWFCCRTVVTMHKQFFWCQFFCELCNRYKIYDMFYWKREASCKHIIRTTTNWQL